MKPLSISLVLFGLLALVRPAHQLDPPGAVLGIVILLCAATTFCSSGISSFLKIFVGIFSAETIVFGLAVLAGRAGLWPAIYAEYLPPECYRLRSQSSRSLSTWWRSPAWCDRSCGSPIATSTLKKPAARASGPSVLLRH